MWREVRLVHREGELSRCRCGRRLDRRKVAMIVDRYPGLGKGRTSRFDSHEATTITGFPMAIGRYQPELAAPRVRGGAHLRRPSPASAGEAALPSDDTGKV
jgi:hypothetical protein